MLCKSKCLTCCCFPCNKILKCIAGMVPTNGGGTSTGMYVADYDNTTTLATYTDPFFPQALDVDMTMGEPLIIPSLGLLYINLDVLTAPFQVGIVAVEVNNIRVLTKDKNVPAFSISLPSLLVDTGDSITLGMDNIAQGTGTVTYETLSEVIFVPYVLKETTV